jgi:AraC family transcriptional regulator of adaptative response / methylphosphotriester-DNA alkyltransferase methyltransferase
MENNARITHRQEEIVDRFLHALDKHVMELKDGVAEKSLELNEFAEMLSIHPTHLSDTVYHVTSKSPCALYEEKLVVAAKDLLANSDKSIAAIAALLTYDPSNFTKFFKRFTGLTPKQYRNQPVKNEPLAPKSEVLTI